MSRGWALVRNEVRIARRDPVPFVVLVAMPAVLMTLLTPSLSLALAAEGHPGVSGAEQSVPGMVCVFTFFGAAFVAFALFREHGWQTWVRLEAAGLAAGSVVRGKLAIPAVMLVGQHVALFAVGVVFLDLEVAGPWIALGLVSLAFIAFVLSMGLAASALLATIQQVNALTNVGAMVLGGLGGGFVPVSTLPTWVQPLAPLSPAYWAMEGYRSVILDGGGVGSVVGPVVLLSGVALALAVAGGRRLAVVGPKRAWG